MMLNQTCVQIWLDWERAKCTRWLTLQKSRKSYSTHYETYLQKTTQLQYVAKKLTPKIAVYLIHDRLHLRTYLILIYSCRCLHLLIALHELGIEDRRLTLANAGQGSTQVCLHSLLLRASC
jgi:hypothetical protein